MSPSWPTAWRSARRSPPPTRWPPTASPPRVIDAFSVKPLDGATILESVAKTRCVVTAEEHSVIGGLGSAVCELLAGADPVCVECVAVRDRFGKSGEFEELLGYFNIDATAIVEAVKKVRERAGLC